MTSGPLVCRTCTCRSPRYFPRSLPHRQRIGRLTMSRSNTGHPPRRTVCPPKRCLRGDKDLELEVVGLVENADRPGTPIASARRAPPATACCSQCERGYGTDATSCSFFLMAMTTAPAPRWSRARCRKQGRLSFDARRDRKAMLQDDRRDRRCDSKSRCEGWSVALLQQGVWRNAAGRNWEDFGKCSCDWLSRQAI